MGFYGNITNTSRTQFSFDRVYANRYELSRRQKTDGVYAGRYVLIEYDTALGSYYPSGFFAWEKQVFGSLFSHTVDNGSLAFIAPDTRTEIIGADKAQGAGITDGTIINITAGHRAMNINKESYYLRLTTTNTFESVGREDFLQWANDNSLFAFHAVQIYEENYEPGVYWIEKRNEDDDETVMELCQDEQYNSDNTYFDVGYNNHIHLINNALVFGKTGANNGVHQGAIIHVPKGYAYSTNTNDELWQAHVDGDNVTWKQIASAESNYQKNFNIDVETFGSSRGYDSTVWQKVYNNGVEKYVMIAELNTVVPTFDIKEDAPSLVPISPHFDTDSTNVYYKVHWQPQWGFRTKAANNLLLGPQIQKNGLPNNISNVLLSVDRPFYPSDVETVWESSFYDTGSHQVSKKYFDGASGLWVDEKDSARPIPAAIYFNKNGFNAKRISYSKDLLADNAEDKRYIRTGWENKDEILFSNTGCSGKLYDPHDVTEDPTAAVDTQELSVMLPSLGNTIAEIWDIIYGGRLTTDKIKNENKRNTDIAWEDASTAVVRNGLRLVSEKPDADGFTYNTARYDTEGKLIADGQINTLAGCINSVHDLMGMIIVTNDELADKHLTTIPVKLPTGDTIESYDDAEFDKIYYFKSDGTYRRKHTEYEYTEIDYAYRKIELTDLTYIANVYYRLPKGETFDSSKLVVATESNLQADSYDYYERIIDPNSEKNQAYVPVDLLTFKHTDRIPYYQTLLGDWVYETSETPRDGVNYYQVSLSHGSEPQKLGGSYSQNMYYYLDPDSHAYILEEKEAAEAGRIYYTIFEDLGEAKVINQNLVNKDSYNKETHEYIYDYENVNGVMTPKTKPLAYLYAPGFFFYHPFIVAHNEEDPTLKISEEEFTTLVNDQQLYRKAGTSTPESESYVASTNFELVPVGTVYNPDPNEQYFILSGSLLKDINPKPTFGRQYYLVDADVKELEKGETTMIETENGYEEVNLLNQVVTIKFAYKVNIIPFLPDRYYWVDPKDIFLWSDTDYGEESEGNDESAVNPDDTTGVVVTRQLRKKYQKLTADTLKEHYKRQFIQSTNGTLDSVQEFHDYFTLAPTLTDQFYCGGVYWYQPEGSKNWVLDRNPQKTDGRDYYLYEDLVIALEYDGIFYRPNEFYYKDGDEYLIDRGLTPSKSAYFRKNDFYVLSDTNNVFAVDSVWNRAVDAVPASVKLAVRTEYFGMQPLHGFARTLNTIHGLIMKINELCDFDNLQTRDRHTLQGALNTVNDIIDKFAQLAPKQFTVVDAYGRIHSAPWTTQQEFSTSNLQESHKAETNAKDATENRWITADIDANVVQPTVIFGHNFTPVPSTTTTSNKNVDTNDITSSGKGNNNTSDDTLKLYTPIVDNMGHVVGHNIETVTLPYSYKTYTTTALSTTDSADLYTNITEGNDTTASSSVANATTSNSVASNTKDTLAMNPVNKWIQTKFTNDKLEIAHEIHAIDERPDTTNFNNSSSDNHTDTLVVQDLVFDKAGHVTSNRSHTYTLPYSFKFIKTNGATAANVVNNLSISDNAEIAADSTQDILNINAGNKWIRIATNGTNDTLTIAHEVNTINVANVDATDLNANAANTITVNDITHDAAGHITANRAHTYTLPYGFKFITGSNSDATDAAAITNPNTTKIAADTTQDTLSVTMSNKWIKVDTNTEDTLKLGHVLSGVTANSYGDTSVQTPNFGDTFKVIGATVDAAGHITAMNSHTVTIPKCSVTDSVSNGADVITKLSLIDSTGAFTTTRTNVGTLLLTGYEVPTKGATLKVVATDSINTAFNKVEAEIIDINNTIGALDVEEVATVGTDGATTFVSGVTQVNGKISVSTNVLPTGSTSVAGIVKLSSTVSDEAEDVAATPKGVKAAIDATTCSYQGPEEESATQQTIAWLFAKVAELEQKIYDLEHQTDETPTV